MTENHRWFWRWAIFAFAGLAIAALWALAIVVGRIFLPAAIAQVAAAVVVVGGGGMGACLYLDGVDAAESRGHESSDLR